MNVFLIGYRATGKTTVAQLLAKQLGWEWIDADHEIERRAGKPIAQVFSDDGEPTFRDWESVVVKDLASRDKHVIALGGGAVMRDENRQAIEGRGIVVWLAATAETILDRLQRDRNNADRRPALTESDLEDEVRQLLQIRTPVYADCANQKVDTDGKPPAEVSQQIFDALPDL